MSDSATAPKAAAAAPDAVPRSAKHPSLPSEDRPTRRAINVVRQVPHAAGVDVVVDDRGSGEPVGKDKCA
jgi:hypothetical protein